ARDGAKRAQTEATGTLQKRESARARRRRRFPARRGARAPVATEAHRGNSPPFVRADAALRTGARTPTRLRAPSGRACRRLAHGCLRAAPSCPSPLLPPPPPHR